VHRRFRLRADDRPPQWREIALHAAGWSVASEVIAPHFFTHATADPWDVAAYAGGALLSGLVWPRG